MAKLISVRWLVRWPAMSLLLVGSDNLLCDDNALVAIVSTQTSGCSTTTAATIFKTTSKVAAKESHTVYSIALRCIASSRVELHLERAMRCNKMRCDARQHTGDS